MTTAFVLSGGGSLGAVQVGMLGALLEHEILPDLLVGPRPARSTRPTWPGRGMTPESVADLGLVWLGIRRHDVFGLGPWRLARRHSARRRDSIGSSRRSCR